MGLCNFNSFDCYFILRFWRDLIAILIVFIFLGDCKFKSNCKYHHPKNRNVKSPPCALSDKGLPLRPEQNICSHYSLYGICKFGLACKFDHPIDPPSSPMTGVDQHSSYGISVTTENAGVAGSGSGSGSDATLQQPE
ncbi:zinc finger CCCH domain-containing protein 57-like [Quercus lobata]|uniref:zinc finger CCCH domain-containing protein 57-like n=1 Tax=Quercus lobata TaxID=97700 RepID=UPI0012490BBF|nr:zinc finger CCCH domain-containing protein 57-like [Quercus lobata]